MKYCFTFIALVLVSCTLLAKPSVSLEEQHEHVIEDTLWGYRFQIYGDFNGDGVQDTLRECYINTTTGRETPKYDAESSPIYYGKEEQLKAFLDCSATGVDSMFHIGGFGVHWLENIGDIDGDGADEIGLVPFNMDFSSLNSYRIYSYKNKWTLIASFGTHEWLFPPLPSVSNQYGLFGHQGRVRHTSDSLNKVLEEGIHQFKYTEIIAPKVLQLDALLDDSCDQMYEYVPDQKVHQDYILIEGVNSKYDKLVQKRYIKYDLAVYSQEVKSQIIEQAKSGTLDICDPATEFTILLYFN